MSGRAPDEIWEEGLDEGERRLGRSAAALAATGFAGGADVFFGIVAVVVTTGALSAVMPMETAHVLGALTFGIAFALITLGRAELFTENFLIPVSAVFAGRSPRGALLRMWGITFVFNTVGLLLGAALFAPHGVLPPAALDAAGSLADTVGTRDVLPALLSAIAAGTVMTLFTWIVAAADDSTARLIASLLVGFLLLAPSLNHAVVGFGEVLFGLLAGTTDATWGDLARNTGLAIAGNLIGGVGLVFATRLAQVRGEPGSRSGKTATGR
ncbi:MAG: formate-nitrite transporter family protein [Solirubrobacteraceae bacterium]|jgi:formate/nitrite transporter FocA (FNT family)|nr:formate-nitrite transporter family protein [Solirubrobacteraceae bacterium]